jgi:hypothetical protein
MEIPEDQKIKVLMAQLVEQETITRLLVKKGCLQKGSFWRS